MMTMTPSFFSFFLCCSDLNSYLWLNYILSMMNTAPSFRSLSSHEKTEDSILNYSDDYGMRQRNNLRAGRLINSKLKNNTRLKAKLGYEINQLKQVEHTLYSNKILRDSELLFPKSPKTEQSSPIHFILKGHYKNLVKHAELLEQQKSELAVDGDQLEMFYQLKQHCLKEFVQSKWVKLDSEQAYKIHRKLKYLIDGLEFRNRKLAFSINISKDIERKVQSDIQKYKRKLGCINQEINKVRTLHQRKSITKMEILTQFQKLVEQQDGRRKEFLLENSDRGKLQLRNQTIEKNKKVINDLQYLIQHRQNSYIMDMQSLAKQKQKLLIEQQELFSKIQVFQNYHSIFQKSKRIPQDSIVTVCPYSEQRDF